MFTGLERGGARSASRSGEKMQRLVDHTAALRQLDADVGV
jgi:hypothetical protein